MGDILDGMMLTPALVEQSIREAKEGRGRNPEVCICGHPARSHSSKAKMDSPVHRAFKDLGVEKCFPARQQCPCIGFRGVVKSSDVRLFVFKTTGSYERHALFKGIFTAREKGLELEKIGDWNCDTCGSTERVGPVPVDNSKREAAGPTPRTFLLCAECVEKLRRGELFA